MQKNAAEENFNQASPFYSTEVPMEAQAITKLFLVQFVVPSLEVICWKLTKI